MSQIFVPSGRNVVSIKDAADAAAQQQPVFADSIFGTAQSFFAAVRDVFLGGQDLVSDVVSQPFDSADNVVDTVGDSTDNFVEEGASGARLGVALFSGANILALLAIAAGGYAVYSGKAKALGFK